MQIMSPLMCGGGQTVNALPLLLFKGDLALLLQSEGLLRESREQDQQRSHQGQGQSKALLVGMRVQDDSTRVG